MQGFDDKALILFPFLEDYEDRSSEFKSAFNYAVDRMLMYLRSNNIVPHMFITDDVARALERPNVQWVATLSRADQYFADKYCEGMAMIPYDQLLQNPDLFNEITAKDPGEKEMSQNQRFEMVLRHCNKACQAIIPMYKIVIHFKFKSKMQYKVSSKPNDGKIRINIDAMSLVPECLLSGMKMDACDLLRVPWGNRSLTLWEEIQQ